MPTPRPPAVAGRFYPASKKELAKKIEKSFEHEFGPGEIPKGKTGDSKVRGAVVPHAGYDFSGPIAAHVFGAIVKGGFPESFIILGPKHPDPFATGTTPDVGITKEDFETPFGIVSVDESLADEIVGGPVEVDSDMHASEHSIEVQLPFLQYFESDFKFVPICISEQEFEVAEKVGKSIRNAVKDRDVCIIASTDFSHVGSRYGQSPPRDLKAGEFAEKQDKKAIEKIENLDAEGLSKVVNEENISMCGPAGVQATILSLEEDVKEISLLKYATSQDFRSGNNAVGYGGIVFK